MIWTIMTLLAIPIILMMPNLLVLYSLDRDLFIDWDATQQVKMYYIPHKGLPTAFAQLYNIMAILWGDYTFLVDETRLSISFTHMLQMLVMAVL